MEARAYIGWETPCLPWGGCGPGGWGATGPPPSTHPRLGTSLQIQKNYIKVLSPVAWATGPLSPLGRATGGHFRNFSKRTYIFEIFIFFNIKRKRRPYMICLFYFRKMYVHFIASTLFAKPKKDEGTKAGSRSSRRVWCG